MNLRKALVESVQRQCSGSLQEKVERFIKAPRREEKASPFSVVTLENASIGISYNLFHRDCPELQRYKDWDERSVIGREAREIIKLFLSDDAIKRTPGLAVLNALSQEYMRDHPGSYQLDFETDIMDLMNPDKSTRVGLVGYFYPMIDKLMPRVSELIVLEKSEALLAGSYPFTMTGDPADLERCEKVLITATTVLNDTLADLLPHCRNAGFVGVMGPTAGFLPDVLFELGIHAVGSTWIDDPALFLDRFTSGIKWGDSTRKVWNLRKG
ncbi:MAG: DUF364 domain-containing protein [Deltaproteobacteria bacterium]|nr:DUF364 domain-containing protein [Deltaproteobacteria bacterium]